MAKLLNPFFARLLSLVLFYKVWQRYGIVKISDVSELWRHIHWWGEIMALSFFIYFSMVKKKYMI